MMQSCSKDDSEDFASGGNSTKESLELQITDSSGITGIPVIHAVSILKYFIPAYLHEDPALYFK